MPGGERWAKGREKGMLSELEVKETGRLSNTMSVSRCMGSCVFTYTHRGGRERRERT